jgi:hypothetical protein
MEKLLYFAQANIEEDGGITKKIKGQIAGLSKNGFECIVCGYSNDGVAIFDENLRIIEKKNVSNMKRNNLIHLVKKHIKNKKIDVAYIRYSHLSFYMLTLYKKMHKQKIRIFLEIASYPIKYNNNIKYKFFKIANSILSFKLKKYINRTLSIGVPTSTIFGIKNINIPNGINFNLQMKQNTYNFDSHTIKFLSVSSMFGTHGIHRLIEGLKIYYEKFPKSSIELHLVGNGPTKSVLCEKVIEYQLEKKVIFHGQLEAHNLEKVFQLADIGVGPIGIYVRKYASPLKTKEYISRGIPFIISYKEVCLPDNLPFIFYVTNDDSPIDIQAIIEKYKALKNTNYHIEMKNIIEKYLKWENILSVVQ